MWKPDVEQIAEEVKNAPSIFNSQPWFFKVISDDRIELHARLGELDGEDARRRDLPPGRDGVRYLDPLAREFAISCGAALYNLRLAIRVAGHDLGVRLPPHPTRDHTLLASVEIMTGRVKAPTIAEQELYEAMWWRHTDRWPHTIVPAPLAIIVAMENAAFQEGASLRLLHPRQARKWLRLAVRADRFFEAETPPLSKIARQRYQKHQEYRKEYLKEYRNLGTEKQDGVPTNALGPTPKNRFPTGKPTREDFWGPGKRRFERPPLLDKGPFERPQLMALSTDDDQLLDWLRAGQALQHAILTGTRYSMSPPYGVTAKYHAPYRYGLPGRHHLVRRWRRDLAYDGLSVSLLTQPLERYDIMRYDTGRKDEKREDAQREDAQREDAELRDAALRPRPLPWRFAELPQVVIRVGYAVHPAGVTPRQQEREKIIADARLKPQPGVHHTTGSAGGT